ncbi:hypothetical protein NE865_07864 [Phthorimaea operculella]|nr:hypothetical protein NE865_07864 [Phthorimaea operculella]
MMEMAFEDTEQADQKISRMYKINEHNLSTYGADFYKHDLCKASRSAAAEAARPVARKLAKPRPKGDNEKTTDTKYLHTMSKWKNRPLPFNTYIYPDPVLGVADPRATPEPIEPPRDVEMEKVRKTRPRVVPPSAASLDDIEDPEARAIIIDDTYISTLEAAQRLTANVAFHSTQNVKAPLGNTFAPAKPLDLPKLQPPVVPPEWRMESCAWDRDLDRAYVEPTVEFWKRFKRPARRVPENKN